MNEIPAFTETEGSSHLYIRSLRTLSQPSSRHFNTLILSSHLRHILLHVVSFSKLSNECVPYIFLHHTCCKEHNVSPHVIFSVPLLFGIFYVQILSALCSEVLSILAPMFRIGKSRVRLSAHRQTNLTWTVWFAVFNKKYLTVGHSRFLPHLRDFIITVIPGYHLHNLLSWKLSLNNGTIYQFLLS